MRRPTRRMVVVSMLGAAVVIVVAAALISGGGEGDEVAVPTGTREPTTTEGHPVEPSPSDPPPDEAAPDEAVFPEGATVDHEVVTIVEPSGFMDPEDFDPALLPRLAAEVQVVRDQQALHDLWHDLSLHRPTQHHEGSAPPQFDFAEDVVFLVLQGTPASCADPLRLVAEGSTLWFRFEPFDGGCHLRQGWALYVVTVRRDQLPESFVLERDYYGLTPPDDRWRQEVTLPPSAAQRP